MPPKADSNRRREFRRTFAKSLRADATDAERILWSLLRRGQLGNLRFRRQQTIGPYVADFFCAAAKLIVELDGSQHGTNAAIARDDNRTRFLEERGYCVLRFWNTDFLKDRQAVLDAIHRTAITHSSLNRSE